MPEIDFDKVEDVQDYTPVPQGKYRCKLIDVEKSSTQFNDEMWNLRFQILDGEHAGRMIFDRISFSEAGMKRVKFVASRLGFKAEGRQSLEPEMILGRSCVLNVLIEEYTDDEGKHKKRNVVPFAGYDRLESATEKPAKESDEEEAF